MHPQGETREWYFVCPRCSCKFFHNKAAAACPRCEADLTSNEQLTPPWRPKLLKVGEAAERLSLSVSKVYQLLEAGTLAHHRIGGALRISEEQLRQYLDQTKRDRSAPASPVRKSRRPRLRHIQL